MRMIAKLFVALGLATALSACTTFADLEADRAQGRSDTGCAAGACQDIEDTVLTELDAAPSCDALTVIDTSTPRYAPLTDNTFSLEFSCELLSSHELTIKAYGAQSGSLTTDFEVLGNRLVLQFHHLFPNELVDIVIEGSATGAQDTSWEGPWVGRVFAASGVGAQLAVAGTTTLSSDVYDLALADLDGNDSLDLITAVPASSGASQPSEVYLDPSLDPTTATSVAATTRSQAVAAIDLDGDLLLDVVLANREDPHQVCTNESDFETCLDFGAGMIADVSMAAGDIDNDGDQDLVVVTETCAVHVFANEGAPPDNSLSVVTDGSTCFATALADVNGDGLLDLLIGHQGGVQLHLGDGAGFEQGTAIGGTRADSLGIGDLNGDGAADVVAAGPPSTGLTYVLINEGDGTFRESTQISAGGSAALRLGDLDGDGDLDLVLALPSGGALYRNNGDGELVLDAEALSGLTESQNTVVLGDLDNDQTLDMVFGGVSLTIVENR